MELAHDSRITYNQTHSVAEKGKQAMYKIIGADQKEYGPVSADQLRQWLAEGRVTAQTQVLAEGAAEWKALGTLPEFAAAAGPAPVMTAAPVTGTGAASLVNGPAIGLMVAAVLGMVLQAISLIAHFAGLSMMHGQQMANQPAWVAMLSGTVGVAISLLDILLGVLILVGALKMKKLESYGLAMTASIVAMIPCLSPCCFIGLPIGIWALVVLAKPEVKSAFH
jgi:GYF domain 2